MYAYSAKNNELVFLLAASNLPWDLDAALLRRLEKRILVPLPEKAGREALFRKLLGESKIDEDIDFDKLADKTVGYSGSDIKLLCKEAAMRPLRRLMKKIESPEMNNPNNTLVNEGFLSLIKRLFNKISTNSMKI